jgi:hypothetical protein
LEAPERNVAWILVVSLVMFFISLWTYLWSLSSPPNQPYTITRDVWYNLIIATHLFFTLTVTSSALCLARFAKKGTYFATIFFFTVSMILLVVVGLRPLF